ncbi:phage baseplate protein [Streptomyces sp. 7R007]
MPVPTTAIDLAAPSNRWLWQKATLKEPTVLQSFAFDEKNRHLYVVQVTATGHEDGDLCLNQLDYEGKRLGYMYLKGFGHGVAFGVQNDEDGTAWIWTECAAVGGYGRGVTRFRFADGTTLTNADITVRRPIPGSTSNQPSVDMTSKRVCVRHRMHGVPRYRVWDLDAFTAENYADPIADFAQTGAHPDPDIAFQGYALHGDQVYQLAGTAYDDTTNPPAGHGNAYVSCLDIHTGELLQRTRTQAGYSLVYREPEGVGIRAGKVHLGFASGELGARRFSIYVKEPDAS